MNLNYDKIKNKYESGGNHWTSYSDLFLVLSVVFLLLYVIANLRSSTMSYANRQAVLQAETELASIKEQLRVYESIQTNQELSPEHVKVYEEVIGKLELLEEDAKEKRVEAERALSESKQKEQELNRYQSLVKSIATANLIAKSQIKERDNIIESNEVRLKSLSEAVKEKQKLIAQNDAEISRIQEKLQRQLQELKSTRKQSEKSKKQLESQISELKQKTESEIQTLKAAKISYQKQLAETESELKEKTDESEKLLATLEKNEAKYNKALSDLKTEHQLVSGKLKKKYEAMLSDTKLSAETKLKRAAEYQAELEGRNQDYQSKLKGLSGELENTRSQIKKKEAYLSSLKGLEEKDLERKELASRIKRAISRAGVGGAFIDPKTGDLVLTFKDEYFDKNSSDLKPGMITVLKKLFPAYSKSLFEDKKIAEKIGSIELIGFASPTFNGKYVDPNSIDAKNKAAVNFNMDLSYRRAKSIFNFVFDSTKFKFDYQHETLPYIKVSGRSYLTTEKIANRKIAANATDEEYCKVYDCRKSQRVIIKFTLKNE